MNAAGAVQCIGAAQEPFRTCPLCKVAFRPKKAWQAFCCAEHRTAYDQEFGTLGKVATVRKIKTGVSVSIHLTGASAGGQSAVGIEGIIAAARASYAAAGPAAERALNLALGELVRLVKQP